MGFKKNLAGSKLGDSEYDDDDDYDDLYIIGAVYLSVRHKSHYLQAGCLKVSGNSRNDKKYLEAGEIFFSHF